MLSNKVKSLKLLPQALTTKHCFALIAVLLTGAAAVNIYLKGISFEQLFIYTPILILVCAWIANRNDSSAG